MLALILCEPMYARASSPKQFQYPITIGGRTSGTVIVIGWQRDKTKIKKLVDLVVDHANAAYKQLDARNARTI